ncbi:hypothetical protein C1645_742990 [Glomus cerebriforme]|uniref:DUF7431 domain-containing protein n=1 Tax=Glomus cerebriforme TaxID=658196 RepID=A0A397SFP1_9GLOM|nr:hypothetical protein C1645_742990 [Glomus cerebriforme]
MANVGQNVDDVDITVQIDDPPSKLVLVNLNIKDKLSNIRERLEQNSKIKMNNTLSFANSLLAEVAKEDEEKIILEKIIDKTNKILYLKTESEPDCEFLKDKLKLEYGRTVNLEIANKKAFTIVEDCEMTEIVDGCKNSTIEIDLEADHVMKNDLLLTAGTDHIHNFAKLGVSFERSKIKRSDLGTNSIYTTIEYGKVSLKFKLESTMEFIEAVEDVIKSKDPRNLKNITEEFGQFISTEVILGGRAYFKRSNILRKYSEGKTNKYDMSASNNIRINNITENLRRDTNNSKCECFKLIGGSQSSVNNFDDKTLVESLRDFRNWSCIEFKDPISIFQLLSEDLRKKILLIVGKKIFYTNIEDCFYNLFEHTSPKVFKMNIPENILKLFQNKDADCSIFATVVDKKEKDIFNCQILWSPNEVPKLVIHCIQKKIKKRKCKLKVRWMIVGYDINFNFNNSDFNIKLEVLKNNFNTSNCQNIVKTLDLEYDSSALCFGIPVLRKLNTSNNSLVIGHHFFDDKVNRRIGSYMFSYCLEKNHYVNLPDFTFHTLIISNYSNSDNWGILPFQCSNKLSNLLNFFDFTKSNALKSKPKFISLYSTGENYCSPIFLKQKMNGIKIKQLSISCIQDDCICKSKKLKDNLKYAFLGSIKGTLGTQIIDQYLKTDHVILDRERFNKWFN